ncbi:hypothetical protein [Alterisphingorhabdus coralli]|uniref:Uncharacterized protein n=1 Tax=Alterisphingorhabdus coralli TaxID=3071408 RepID=A0AA97I268_9SPHN|nr:hypothetical protein [Parasphingorhabdus sp. SCSIO 66989]WOE76065.1 hypothetical protein RB602_04925 [Parasphingorhabdus sp. SCSIO 66989]
MSDNTDLEPASPQTPQKRPTAAGGVFIALGTMGGAIAGGALFGEPVIGLLIGFGLGVAAAIVVAMLDSK